MPGAAPIHDRSRPRALAASPDAERGVLCRSGSIEPEAPNGGEPCHPPRMGQRIRRRGADAGPADPRAVHPLGARLLPAQRDLGRLRRGDGPGRTLAAAWAEVGRGVAIDAQECRSGRRAGQDCCEWGFTLRDVGALLAR